MDWVASRPPFREAKHKKIIEKGRNKGMLPGEVLHCNFFFVALLLLVAKWLSIRFPFSNCNRRHNR